MDMTISQIIDILPDFGYSIVFLWLLLREVARHDETRRDCWDELRRNKPPE